MSASQEYFLGLDIGSTTVKLALLDNAGQVVATRYERHGTAVRATLANLLTDAAARFPQVSVRCAITGSGALDLSKHLALPFIQELLATARAVAFCAPDTTVAVELGGEDAKLLYLGQDVELRMNESCAGGTGAFIDQMARLLNTDAGGLNTLAARHTTLYPIASRCGVFAKTDIVPLLNGGVPREDIAASIFQAVVEQTIGGLACGRPIAGKVAFLGGPLHFLPELKKLFISTLQLADKNIATLPDAQCTAAIGAARCAMADASSNIVNLENLARQANDLAGEPLAAHISALPRLFADQAEYAAFRQRHATANALPMADIRNASGPIYLGLDLGSTTVKAVLTDASGHILDSCYASNGGNPLQTLLPPLADMLDGIPTQAWLAAAGATGYGARLAASALGVDVTPVETLAHFKAAARLVPSVSYVIDIGGQDMKCLKVENGVISDVNLNEACSAGCGAFLESFARGLNLSMEEFVRLSLFAAHPADLGSRCTVFMNSRVTQAQKDGLQVADIAAGLCYSVVRNALDKVLRIKNLKELGPHVVVQGGSFLNDALLCAMERTLGRHVHRPAASGLMGAYGAALEAQQATATTSARSAITPALIRSLAMRTRSFRCRECGNRCLLTETRFSNGARHIAGNRCDKFSEARNANVSPAPNLLAWKYKRLFSYEPLPIEQAPRGRLGIPRVLNVYTHYPFWFTLFTTLGFRVELSPPTNRALFAAGLASVPSQSVCYPAKLAHGHVLALLEQGVKRIFFPCIPREAREYAEMCDSFSCPVACGYPQVVRDNLPDIKEMGAVLHTPFVNLNHTASLTRHLCREFSLPRGEVRAAIRAAREAQARYQDELHLEAQRMYEDVRRHKGMLVVLAGRPYHTDPQVHHGLPDFIASLGATVISEDALPRSWATRRLDMPLRARNQWTYPARLYRAAAWVAGTDHGEARVELVQLTSFGCGIDAITTDQMKELLRAHGKLYTLIKMDEGNALASARIRIRSLLAVSRDSHRDACSRDGQARALPRRTDGIRTILVPQMAPLHFPLISGALAGESRTVRLLPKVCPEAVSLGQAYVNNDACYPAIVAIGQLLHTLQTEDVDPSSTALLLSQTCGPCRASNYPGLLRKALRECGHGDMTVLTLSASGGESQTGLRLDRGMLWRLLLGMLAGDMVQRLATYTGTYERHRGQTEDLTRHWLKRLTPVIAAGDDSALRHLLPLLTHDYAAISTEAEQRPRVAVVGEILLNYHPDANRHIVTQIRQEGGEPLLPDITNFMLYCLRDAIYDWHHQGGSLWPAFCNSLAMRRIEGMRRHMRAALNTSPISERVMPITHIDRLVRLGESVLSLGNAAGEGWLLPAEMLEFLEHGTSNILCLQPFGCLPNHVVGRGAFKAVRRQRPEANIMALDYDPGSSSANQLNRIRLFMAIAREREEERRQARHSLVDMAAPSMC
ncbi:MAG: 2-hydroxyacyl-CoA dehydratase [Desulfovibrio sp.]|nr:2-hydroxyacyl-CoA dehydratase [Desulfovibrio sp.]